jgi:hypothetical protein
VAFTDTNSPLGLEGAAAWIVANPSDVSQHLAAYLTTYRGRHFEWFAARSDPSRFTPHDILAVASLSISIPTDAAFELVADERGRFVSLIGACQRLLAARGSATGLHDLPLEDGPLVVALTNLYEAVRDVQNVGMVTASKLLAAKFPSFIPIRDARVEWLLGLRGSRKWWAPMQELLNSPGVIATLEAADVPATSEPVTILRRLDIVLWREAEQRQFG